MSPAPLPPTDEPLIRFAAAWRHAIGTTTFVVSGGGKILVQLRELTRHLTTALTGEPFTPEAGQQVGRDLVAANIATPAALQASLEVLGRLIPELGITHSDAPARLVPLLAQVAAGFTDALHHRDLAAGESINRAERVAWRAKEQALRDQIEHALRHDPQTGLPNRASLLRALHGALTDPAGGERLGLCLLEVDQFTAIRDSLGPDAADQLLRAVARQLRRLAAARGYYLAHLEGPTFAVVVEYTTTVEDVAKAAEQAMRALPDPYPLAGHALPLGARAGIVEHDCARTTPQELLRMAGQALGWAKTDRRSWMGFHPDRDREDRTRHALSADMFAALHDAQFSLAYQPLVRLRDGRIIGVEALARWHHPTHGPISPSRFIPMASQTGLIIPLGRQLLHRACTQAVIWQRHSNTPILVAVNLSPEQLRQPDLTAGITEILDRTGLDPRLLVLEITEDALVNDTTAVHTLTGLRAIEIRVAIDDFGRGYSNLAALHTIPADILKLDATFLRHIQTAEGGTHPNASILPTLIGLGRQLGLTVLAEGIETESQAHHLTRLGCDLGQGYHLGHPATPPTITNLLTAQNTVDRSAPQDDQAAD